MPRLVSDFVDNLYLTYPHNNGFADGGQALILGQNTESEAVLWKCGLDGRRTELCRFDLEGLPERMLWTDTAAEANLTVAIAQDTVWLIDLARPGPARPLFAAPSGHTLHPLPAIRADGRRVVFGLYGPERFAAALLDVASGEVRVLFEKPWMIDHFHFCPYDPEWIGFSHEGPCEKVLDRVWAWHAVEAPEGRCFFDQMAAQPQRTLFAGHERWSFHDRSVLVVAYGAGPARPRGIYEAFTDGRPQRLISEGDRDLHLNVTRDGRWIAVDTSGPHDAPGKGWEDARGISDVLVIDRATGRRHVLARSTISRHPSHPHPVFSPDGRLIYYNEGTADGARNRVCCVENPLAATA